MVGIQLPRLLTKTEKGQTLVVDPRGKELASWVPFENLYPRDVGERVGLGSMGFKISIGDKSILNLGDSLLLPDWDGLRPTVLMIPLGGLGQNTWTMDVDDALQAVDWLSSIVFAQCLSAPISPP